MKYSSRSVNKPKVSPSQIIILSFASIIFVGTLLLMLPWATTNGHGLVPLDALFVSTSATCVTGLTYIDLLNDLTMFGQIIVMLLIQFGGLGLMTISTILLVMLGWKISLRNRMLVREALNQDMMGGVIRMAKNIGSYTLIVEGIGAVILAIRFSFDYGISRGIYYGIFHSVSAFNNAGFDLMGKFQSLTGYVGDVTVNLTICFLIILGGIGYTVVSGVYYWKEAGRLQLHVKVVLITTAWLIVGGTVLILLMEMNNPATLGKLNWGAKLLAAFFQSVTPRTAGFNTIDLAAMHPASQFLLIVLMFIGASPNSTGGGVKTSTLATILATIRASLRDYDEVQLFHRTVPRWIVQKAISITFIALGWVMVVVCLMTLVVPDSFLGILFEVFSAFGTVGLTMGTTFKLGIIGKLLIIVTMFFGRVGPLTFLLAFSKKSIKEGHIKFPEEKVIVG